MAPSESQIQKLISLYRSCECLWNPESPAYHSGSVQEDAWQRITREMKSGLTPDQVKLQVLALRSYYDAECAAIRQSQLEGRSYLPRHSYFKDLLFLGDVLSEETEESKASFCLGQVNCILEDSFILDDYNLIKKDFPQQYSQATVCQCTASFCNRSIEAKPGYTLYKLILEPEEVATSREMKYEALVGNNERSASGNDRYYPTSYCVRCRRKRTGCGRPPCPPSESESSCSSEHTNPCRPKKKKVQKCCSCSSESESQSCSCPQTENNSKVSITNRERYDDWPGPKLCCQTRPKPVPKCRRVSVKEKPCCVDSWKRNNAAMCKRLQAQLAAQRAQDENEPCCCPKVRTCGTCCKPHDRRQSGEDQMNVIVNSPRHGSPQNTGYQSPMDLTAFNNNRPVVCRCTRPGQPNYYNNQQMSDPAPYINNQQMQDPGRYNNDQQLQDPGRYSNNQQIPDPRSYNNDQQLQDPGRYSNNQQIQDPRSYNNDQQLQDPGRYSNNQQVQDPGRYNNNQQLQDPVRYSNDQQTQDPGRYSNNQQIQDPGRYNNDQRMQDPGRYNNDQQMQDPARYNNDQQMQDPARYNNDQQMQDPARYNNDQQMQEPVRYNNDQQMQEPVRYNNDQQMQEPRRYNNDQEDPQMFPVCNSQCFQVLAGQANYFQPQQCNVNPTNVAPSSPNSSKPTQQQYVEAEYVPCPALVNEYGRSSNPEQPNSIKPTQQQYVEAEYVPCPALLNEYGRSSNPSPPNSIKPTKQQYVEAEYVPCPALLNEYGRSSNPEQPNSIKPTQQQYVEAEYVPCPALLNEYGRSSNPEQPNVCYYVVENPNPICQARCAYSGPPDPDNRYSADTSRYTEQVTQEQPVAKRGTKESQEDYDYKGSPVKRDQQWEPDHDPRDYPNRGHIQRASQNDNHDVDQSPRLSRGDDNVDSVPITQNNDYMEDSVRRGPEYYEERPHRRRSRKSESERKCYYACPYYRQRNDYEEESAAGRQSMPDRVSYNTDYGNSPSQKRRKSDDYADTPTKRKLSNQSPRRSDQTNLSSKSPRESRKKPQRQDYGETVSQNSQNAGLPTDNYNGSQKPKVIQQGTGYWQYVECPAYNTQNPKDCPSYRQSDQRRQDREKRISNKTRPPSRNSDKNQSSRNRKRSTVESESITSFEEETIQSSNGRSKEGSKSKRRKDDNYCNDDTCDYIVRRDKDRVERKNRLGENGKGKSKKRAVQDTCTDDTCPYATPSELRAAQNDISSKPTSPKRKSKRRSEDEPEPKRSSKNKCSARKPPQTVNNTKDNERHKKGLCSPGKSTKNKAITDDECECYSDDNIYDQSSYRQSDRYDGVERGERSTRESYKHDSIRSDRNDESYKNNERSQKLYQSENTDDDCEYYDDYIDNGVRNDYWDDCACSTDASEVMRESNNQNYRRDESPSNGQKYKAFEEYDNERPTQRRICRNRNENSVSPKRPSQKSKGTDVYESENDYRTSSPKRNDEKLPSKKQSHKSRAKELPESEYDPCSCDERKDNRKRPAHSPLAQGRNDQTKNNNNLKKDYRQERSGETVTDLDPRAENTYSKRDTDTSAQIKSPRKYRDEQNDPDAVTKNGMSEKRDTEECKCEYEKEENDKNINENSALKSERVEDDCICETRSDPFEAKIPTSCKRNPAGNGGLVGMECPRHHSSDTNCVNKPWEYTFHIDLPFPEKSKLVVKKKKMPCPEDNSPLRNVKSSKVKSASASPTRSAVPPKTQASEPVKKRTLPRTGVSSISNGRRSPQCGAKRTFDTNAAANSKLPHEINSASFFICKLQDDDKAEQYLVVVPKESIGLDRHREDPGQGPWKQLHCQRQFSGFQSVPWVNPASTVPVCQSPPLPPTEDISELCSSVVPPGLKDDTLDIIKKYFQQSMLEGNPVLMGSVHPQRMLKTALSGPKRHKPVLRPSNNANDVVLAENRTVLLTNNPFQNLNLSDNKEEVIVLHPPDPGFRPSKYSFHKDPVEVQLIRVKDSDTDVNTTPAPLPPSPPTKSKQKLLR